MSQSYYKRLEGEVLEWALDKGIFDNPCPKTQALKMASEAGELCDAVAKQDKELIIDGIGDVAVTLILLSDMHGVTLLDCLESAYNEIKGRKGKMVDGLFVKDEK